MSGGKGEHINRSSEPQDFSALEHTAPTNTEEALLECFGHTDDQHLSQFPHLEGFEDVDLLFKPGRSTGRLERRTSVSRTEKAGMRVGGERNQHFESGK